MEKQALKEKICQVIDAHRLEIIQAGESIYSHPELGYKEEFATQVMVESFEKLGLSVEKHIAVTGCRARSKNENAGPRISVLGELDAILCKEHQDADPVTGAIHACGHNIQAAAMLGTAIGLVKSGVMDLLDGSVEFMAVPAEEFVELEFRDQLRKEGKIQYFGGKQELIAKGYFDDVDISMMVHALNMPDKTFLTGPNGNGFIGKKVNFIGKEAHAGSAPQDGINALNAAMLALNNIHAQRETFAEADKIRVHPIITKGGDIVNVVPADVRMELYVRGRTIPGIVAANQKVNRSLKAGAMAIGAQVEIEEIPGYLPLLNVPELDRIFAENAGELVDPDTIVKGGDFTGSFDFGDVSHILPVLHPFVGGVVGALHTREFANRDHELTYIAPAKAMAMTIVDLLYDGADQAKKIIADFKPEMTKEDYLAYMESVTGTIRA
ncbi:amidohydrolase [Gottschalkiaceae bacterium SANA]|nr:amidohydrolase [Gottschalkiaceae bacterium SANA]